MDIADHANELTEMNVNLALSNKADSLCFTGECHWCEAPIEKGHFCDADCRDDWQQFKHRNG